MIVSKLIARWTPMFAAVVVMASVAVSETADGAVGWGSELWNVESELCIDVPGFSTAEGQMVQQYPCNEGSNQQWTLWTTAYSGWYILENESSHKCLTAPNTINRTRLTQTSCTPSSYNTKQLWYRIEIDDYEYAYYNAYSRKCIDIAGGATSAGFYVQQYDCHYDDNQVFVHQDFEGFH